MNKSWVHASTLLPKLQEALSEYSDEDWYWLNVRANERMPQAMHIPGGERIRLSNGRLVDGFTALYRAIQLDTQVLLHIEDSYG